MPDTDLILEQLSQINATMARMDERQDGLIRRVDKIECRLDKRDDNNSKKNWQIWFLLISAVIGGLAGWIFALMRG